MKHHLVQSYIACLLFFGLASPSIALQVSVPLTSFGTQNFTGSDFDTLVLSADLGGISGLTQVGAVVIEDDGTPVGGATGVFSGFDVDAIFLDVDGDLNSSNDRFFGSSFLFSAGTTRPTSDPFRLPTPEHPGPTFGSLNATTIDFPTATLNTLDQFALNSDLIGTAHGVLTLGDGGRLVVNFSPVVPVGSTLFLFVGESGGQPGEGIGANIVLSTVPLPSPATLPLLTIGFAGLAVFARRSTRPHLAHAGRLNRP